LSDTILVNSFIGIGLDNRARIVFAESYRARSLEVGSMVIASTVFSIVTLSITISVLFSQ